MASEIKHSLNEAGTAERPDAHGADEHLGGGARFSRRLLVVVVVGAMGVGSALALGIRSSGPARGVSPAPLAGEADAARDRARVEALAAAGARPAPLPTVAPAVLAPAPQTQVVPPAPRTPSRYAEWAQEKYLKALEAPQMVGAFHSGAALEVGRQPDSAANVTGGGGPAVTLHPPAGPYTVMSGSVIPAVLVSGINSELPGPIVGQVSANVFDTATGRLLLIPRGSRLIGAYRSAAAAGQERVQVSWQRLIFPDTSSMDLPQMPGADQAGYAGFTDQVDHHYLATFGTAALTSLISAGQMVGQIAGFGGGAYTAYGYAPPSQWALAAENAGSAASAQLGGVGQQMVGQGLNRPPTLEVRPGYEFTVLVTADLVFPGPYRG